jgi:hypothetical protein
MLELYPMTNVKRGLIYLNLSLSITLYGFVALPPQHSPVVVDLNAKGTLVSNTEAAF